MAVRWYINLSLCDYQACVLCQGARRKRLGRNQSIECAPRLELVWEVRTTWTFPLPNSE